MNLIVLFILSAIIMLILIGIKCKILKSEYESFGLIMIIPVALSVVTCAMFLFFSINYAVEYAHPASYAAKVEKRRAERAIMETTPYYSDVSLEWYEDVLDFNECVRNANAMKDNWWLRYILYDPTYEGLEPVSFDQYVYE